MNISERAQKSPELAMHFGARAQRRGLVMAAFLGSPLTCSGEHLLLLLLTGDFTLYAFDVEVNAAQELIICGLTSL